MEINDFLASKKAVYLALLRQHETRIVEVSGKGYRRQPVLVGVNFEQVSPGEFVNSQRLDFGTATDKWGLITQAVYCDESKGGIILANAGGLHLDIQRGDNITIPIGGLRLTVHKVESTE